MEKMEMNYMKNVDPDVYNAIMAEKKRQEEGIELIASENLFQRQSWKRQDPSLPISMQRVIPKKILWWLCKHRYC